MLARVRKSLQSDGKILEIGDIVDISTWRNAKTLIASRYVELVKDAPVSKPKAEKKETVEEVKIEKTKTKK